MTRLTVTTFLTLDGVMQSPGGPEEDPSGGFDLGGWLVPFADADMGRLVGQWFAQADAFLLGRRTYEIFASFWPNVTDPNDPVASGLNSLPKYVASKTLDADAVTWNNTTLLTGDLVEEVRRLKAEPGRELQVHGSGDLLQTLMAHDLVDEFRLWVYPVLLGRGRRLFREGRTPSTLKLVGTETTSAGVVVQSYQPSGKLEIGSFLDPGDS